MLSVATHELTSTIMGLEHSEDSTYERPKIVHERGSLACP